MSLKERQIHEVKDAFDQGLFGKCIRLATAIATSSESRSVRCIALFFSGLAYDARGEQERAIKAYAEGEALYSDTTRHFSELVDVLALALTSFAFSLLAVQRREDAERVARMVIEDASLRKTIHASWAEGCLAQIYSETGRYPEAAQLYGRAIEGLRQSRNSIIELMISRARCLITTKDYEGAGASLRQALLEEPSPEQKADILMLSAEVTSRLGAQESAVEYLEEAKYFVSLVGGSERLAMMVDFATIAYNAGQPRVALEVLHPIVQESGGGQERLHAIALAAECYYMMEDYDTASGLDKGIEGAVRGTPLELRVRRLLVHANAFLGRWDSVNEQVEQLKLSGLGRDDEDLSRWILHSERSSWSRLLRRKLGEFLTRMR